jgi:UDP-N-acetylglucosamine--dolichyl-phosphate N-acetylglucosaminephosphotransferase
MNYMGGSIVAASLISFIFTYVTTPYFNNFCTATGIVGRDLMKRSDKPIADMGGPEVMVGFLTGVFFYISMGIFQFGDVQGLTNIIACISTALIITLIGIFDVLTTLMRKKEGEGMFERMKRRGIPRWFYYFIPIPAAIPLSAIKAGVSKMILPFLGEVEFGIIYPLVLIPLAVLCCSNATNFYAGFNGLEAGMGVALHLSLGIFAFINGRTAATLVAFTFASALLAFLRYNWFPASVFPGDLNYTIGAVCVCVAVIGNIERFAILCFIPWIVEAFLKAFSKFEAENYGVLQKDGTLKPREDGIYSLTHLVMRFGRFKEYQITTILIAVEIVVCASSFVLVQHV